MRTVYKIIGFSLGACVPAAFVYGFWLIHHGLGFIVGALIAACYVQYHSPEHRAKRRANEEERAASQVFVDGQRFSEIRRRGVN